jgi:serine/threonine-protein kinase
MEYVEGETLAELLGRRGRVPPAETVELARQACAGLEHAHRAGLVHRDVKPGNLLVRGDGTLKIADFGIARASETTQLTQAGTILGTAAYLSPEQASGDPVTAAADIYSLGAVVYELLTGRPPYAFDTVAELLALRRRSTVDAPHAVVPEVPRPLSELVLRCLDSDPARRPASAAELGAELAAALEPETAPLEAPTVALPRPGRRPGATVLAAASLLALAVVVAAIAVATHGGSDGSSPAEPPVRAIPRGADARDQARNLAAWLRENAG